MKKRKQIISFFLTFMMVMNILAPSVSKVYGAENSANDANEIYETNENSQVYELPIEDVSTIGFNDKVEVTSKACVNFDFTDPNTTTTTSIELNLSLEDEIEFAEKCGIPIYTVIETPYNTDLEDYYNVCDTYFGVKITQDGESITYNANDENVNLIIENSIEQTTDAAIYYTLMTIPDQEIQSGDAKISIQAYDVLSDELLFSTQDISINFAKILGATYNWQEGNVLSEDVFDIHVDIEGTELDMDIDHIVIEDQEGNIVFTSNDNVKEPFAHIKYSNYTPFQYEYRYGCIDVNLFRTSQIDSSKNYELKVKNETEELTVGKIKFTSEPVINDIEMKLVKGLDNVTVWIEGHNINKDLLEFSMINQDNQVIAKQESSSVIEEFNEQNRHLRLKYTLEVYEPLNEDDDYKIQVTNLGDQQLIINQEEIYEDIITQLYITNIDTSNADNGDLIIYTVNFEEGKDYNIRLHNNYVGDAYTIGKPDENGRFTVHFDDGLMSYEHYSIYIGADTKETFLYIKDKEPYDEDEEDIEIYVKNHILPSKIEDFEVAIESFLPINTDDFELFLVKVNKENDDHETLIGSVDASTWINTNDDMYVGIMSITNDEPLDGESYDYYFKFKYGSTENYDWISVRSDPNVDIRVTDSIEYYNGLKYYEIIPYGSKALSIEMNDVVNVSTEDLKVEISNDEYAHTLDFSSIVEVHAIPNNKDIQSYTYKGIIDISAIPQGVYCIDVLYNGESLFCKDRYLISDEKYFDKIDNPLDNIYDGKSSEYVYLSGGVNVDSEPITITFDNYLNQSFSAFTQEQISEENNVTIKFNQTSRLDEGYYCNLKFWQDDKEVHSENMHYLKYFIITHKPIVLNGETILSDSTESIYAKSYNLPQNAEYKGYIYDELKEIQTLDVSLNDEGNIYVLWESLKSLDYGKYTMYISMDGIIIGSLNLDVDEDIIGDKEPPINSPAFTINNNSFYTNNVDVQLQIQPNSYSQMKIANSQEELKIAEYINVVSDISWKLSQGDEKKTVYMQFKADDGTESIVISKSVLLDTVAPAVPDTAITTNPSKVVVDKGFHLQVSSYDSNINAKAVITYYTDNVKKSKTVNLSYDKKISNDIYSFGSWVKLPSNADPEQPIQAEVTLKDYAGNTTEINQTIEIAKNYDFNVTVKAGQGTVKGQYVELRRKVDDKNWYYDSDTTSKSGSIWFENVPEGSYILKTYGYGEFKGTNKEITIDGTESEYEIILEDRFKGRGQLTINVNSSTGEKVERAWVSISNWKHYCYYYIQTDSNGQAILDNIPVGIHYDVQVWHEGFNKNSSVQLASDGEEKTISVKLPAIGHITGTLKHNNSLIKNAWVIAKEEKDNGRWHWARTDVNGAFDLKVKDDGTTYTIAVENSLTGIVLPQKNVTANTPNVNLVFYEGVSIYGNVKSTEGQNLKDANLYGYGGIYNWGNSTTNEQGNYKFVKNFGPGTHYIHVWKKGHFYQQKTITITENEAKNSNTAKGVDFILTPYNATDTFTNGQNRVRADVSTTQQGKTFGVKVNYENTSSALIEDVTIKAELPEGVSFVTGGNEKDTVIDGNTILLELDSIKPLGQIDNSNKGDFAFVVKVDESFTGEAITIPAWAEYNNVKASIGYAVVNVVGITLNAPEEAKTHTAFKLYGEATKGSTISIINEKTNEVLAVTEPKGKWYTAELSVVEEGELKLFAIASTDGVSAKSETKTIVLDDNAVVVKDVTLNPAGMMTAKMNANTGIASSQVWVDLDLSGPDIDVEVELENTTAQVVKLEFSGNTYEMTDKGDGIYSGTVSEWSGSGTLDLIAKVGDKSFKIGELLILIDPSGYVYDKYLGEDVRIEDATAICEEWVDSDGDNTQDEDEWMIWNAENYGQVNPQTTDSEGKYGWMVPEGVYRVKVQREGYEDYITTYDSDFSMGGQSSIIIPPPRDDVNIGLVSTEQPIVTEFRNIDQNGQLPVNGDIKVLFNKPIDASTIDGNVILTNSNGDVVQTNLTMGEKNTQLIVEPEADLTNGETYRLALTDVKDYSGWKSYECLSIISTSVTFTANEAIEIAFLSNPTISPVNGTADVELDTAITVTFSEAIDKAAVEDGGIRILRNTGEAVSVNMSYNEDNSEVNLIPTGLNPSTTYKIVVESSVKSADGLKYLKERIESIFTTTVDTIDENPDDPSENPDDPGENPDDPDDPDDNTNNPGGSNSPSGGSPSGGSPSGSSTNKTSTSLTLEQGKSGKIQLDEVVVTIPKDTFDDSTRVTIDVLKNTQSIKRLPKAMELHGDIYDIQSSTIHQFNHYVALTLPIPKEVDTSKLAVYYYNEIKDKWIYIGGQVKNGKITAQVKHFTQFAVFSKEDIITFTDISNIWSERYITRLAGMEVTNGFRQADGTYQFKPSNKVTRAEFAAFLVRALDLKLEQVVTLPFDDKDLIPKWALPYVMILYKEGITGGRLQGDKLYYQSDAYITREEAVVMISRAVGKRWNLKENFGFKDKDTISSWADEAVAKAVKQGVISGFDDNTFRPADNTTREQMAAMIIKLLESLGI